MDRLIMEKLTNGQMDRCTDVQMDRFIMEKLTNGHMDRWTYGQIIVRKFDK